MGVVRRCIGPLAVLVAVLSCAPAASAYMRNVRTVGTTAVGNTGASKSLADNPPAPANPMNNTDYALGGGASILDGDGAQAVSSEFVATNIYSPPWNSGGISLDPPAFWSLDGRAIYAESDVQEPATFADSANYVKQVTLVKVQSKTNSKDKMAVAACPSGKHTVSGGGKIVDGGSEVAFDVLESLSSTSYEAAAHEVGPTDRKWSVIAYAYCANITTPAGGRVFAGSLNQNFVTSANDSTDVKTVKADCAPLDVVIGGGAGTLETSNKVALVASYPHGTKWIATARELSTDPGNWSLQVRASCATSLAEPGPHS
jgi:hypothetical protein